jgi:peptidoglycan hydrolase CwlO-like protein
MDLNTALIAIIVSILSGIGTSFISSIKESRRESIRKREREQDQLKLELKDLQIQLYKVEKDLDEWKNKYYNTVEDLISVKAELENTIIQLNHLEMHGFEE